MKSFRWLCVPITIGVVVGLFAVASAVEPEGSRMQRGAFQKAYQDGNYNDAYEGFRKLALDPNDDPSQVGNDLNMAVQCLANLNRMNEVDTFREAVIETHADNWRLLRTAAQNYMSVDHQGYIVAGEFHRGHKRGGMRIVHATDRDRVRALQLMVQAMPLARQDDSRHEVASFLLELGGMFLNNRGYHEAWRLQSLTDLGELPDYEDGWRGHYRQPGGAPVDEEGNPVLHHVPERFDTAETDGQRWRWCLAEAMEVNPQLKAQVQYQFAEFLHNQFGVQTMAHFGWRFGRMQVDDTQKNESGTYALHTLEENETIARLATGVKRFELPDEFNFVKIYQQLAEDSGHQTRALEQLAQIFENRRQYPEAADIWRQLIQEYRRNNPVRWKDRLGQVVGSELPEPLASWQNRLAQITGNWGRFEPVMNQPADSGATVEYRFRNGGHIAFTAHEIDVKKLLDDVKTYLKSHPSQLDHTKLDIGNLGYRLVVRNETRYRGRQVAQWRLDTDPRPDHFDKRITVTTPLQKAGAYLVTAKMDDGNTSHIVLWLADTAIAKKPLDGKTFYYVADAVSGKPVPRANVEFFGWRQEHVKDRTYRVLTEQFAEFSDDDGQVILAHDEQSNNYQWLVTARSREGRFAYLGYTHVWHGNYYDSEYNQTKVFTVTDRPVYRPEQKVQYKFWVRHAQYDKEDVSAFAKRNFTVEIHDPKGERIVQKSVQSDAFGGIEGELELAADATLGVYRLNVQDHNNRRLGGGTFRVEEYKKPEFEVTVDAPSEPVMLGETIEATINAKYYFGSPVTKAKVKYKVTRTGTTDRWYPVRPWDWLFGPGYWWFGYDYDWYPGFRDWGWRRPHPFWWPQRQDPPEVVAEREVEIGPDGTVKVAIDTGIAQAMHPDQDHRYAITAEVVDESRRTIVGTGNVLVARKPFEVTAWADRGYYRTGEVIRANFSARTLDGKPVEGQGTLTVFQIRYEDGKPIETPVYSKELPTNEEGVARSQLKASQAGQYRLAYQLTDAAKHTIEGGYLLTIMGDGFDGSEFRFNHLELVPDQAEYRPGEPVKLMINTDRAGAAVLLFVRPANGVYLPPEMIRMTGKSTVAEIAVVKKDMPNFFVEALTVADGKVYSEVKEIVVPPEKRVLTVDVEPSKETYRPGEDAKVNLRLTDFHGEPFVGSTVVAIYDKSVEYISGGSNVPEIKEFFWKWRRHHNPRTESNLNRRTGNLIPPKTKGMSNLGVFGGTVADEMDAMEGDYDSYTEGAEMKRPSRSRGFGAARLGASMEPMSEMADMAPAPAAPMGLASPKNSVAKSQATPAPPGAPGQPMVQPTVRTQFADTALWVGALSTAKDGTAEVALKMPENLTTWRIKVWGMGHGTKVGQGTVDVVTRKDLILRMQAPRFFVEKDEVVLSANVHNYLKSEKGVQVVLELDGESIEPLDEATQTVKIPADDEARIDWRVKVAKEGEAVIRMKALTDEESDAIEMRFPVYVHGMLKMESYSGSIRPDDQSGRFTIDVPAERRPDETRLEVRYSPTLAGAMVDALPYLTDYPHGCTEQTLNRFLPTVITQKILLDMGLDLDDIRRKRTNLNAQEIGDDRDRAQGWKRFDRNPVFDAEEVRRMVKSGVTRLTEMQLSDGGWGWFSGYGERSSAHTTATVVHGLQIAGHNDVALVPGMMERGVAWLENYQGQQVRLLENALKKPEKKPWKNHADNLDALVYMVLVDADKKNDAMREFLYRDRTRLAVYGMAMFGIALEKQGDQEKLDMLMQNIGQYLEQDDENQTAWLNLPGGYWWYWYGSEYEAHAYYLKLLARTDPKGETARRLVKYLLNNRKHATYWNSTRDTALCIEAMADFLRASGEDKPEMTVEVWLDGEMRQAVEITAANLFRFDNKFVVQGPKLAAGPHTVELKKRGTGPLYFNGYLTNFTLEDHIAKAGLEIKVQRKYYRLDAVDKSVDVAGSRGQVVSQKVEKYERHELENLATLKSGQLVEIELEIDSKNDYEYLIFEDMKPAGFEPVDLRSGYNGNSLGAYVEFRDNRVVFFARRVARGKHSVSYRMRAEIPGRFSALPTKAAAMYAPELKANSDEIKLQVED